MTSVVTAGGISVTTRDVVQDAQSVLDRLVSDGVPRSLSARSAKLWGNGALGWLDFPERPPPPVPVEPADHLILVGSVPGEAIIRAAGRPVTVLDSTDPHAVARVLAGPLDRTVAVVADRCGASLPADAHRRLLEQAFRDAGLDPAERIAVVTDPGSQLSSTGLRTVLADPAGSGAYGALGAYGLVPAALAGVDVTALLAEAAALAAELHQPYENPGLALGAALGASALTGRDKLAIVDHGARLPGFGGWLEQLVAESTGKEGKGILPILVDGVDDPGFTVTPDIRRVILGSRPDQSGPARDAGLSVSGPLGGQILLWQYAAVVACRVMGVNPFDRPERDEAEEPRGLADGSVVVGEPVLVDGPVEVHGPADLVNGAKDVGELFEVLVDEVPEDGYLALTAYLDPTGEAALARLRPALARLSVSARKAPAPVTFGWGPRFQQTIGQYYQGGPQNGVFVQLTGAVKEDVPIPGRPYSLGRLQIAQAFADLRALRARERPALRLHLRDRAEGVATLLSALT
jgi:glucose-6-phosphate isomerase